MNLKIIVDSCILSGQRRPMLKHWTLYAMSGAVGFIVIFEAGFLVYGFYLSHISR